MADINIDYQAAVTECVRALADVLAPDISVLDKRVRAARLVDKATDLHASTIKLHREDEVAKAVRLLQENGFGQVALLLQQDQPNAGGQ
ncbi:MAG: hypothetical protein ACTIDN_00200 [Acetobacter sp.]|uniref:hypothetical protein n=1 Tax=Acetobacter sp. TaxID=440 RepID=UPI003F9037A5